MRESKEAIYFSDYDKISDVLYWLGDGISLKFNVALSSKNQDNCRSSFHKEFAYQSKYDNTNVARTIRRDIDAYLTLDVKGDFKNSVMIRYTNMIMLRLKMKEVVQWFTTLFRMTDDRLSIIGKYDKIVVNLEMNKAIAFEPCVIEYQDGTFKEGVRLFVNSDNIFTEIPIDRYMGLLYIIDTFDIYQNAIILLNYMGRPEFGYNTWKANTLEAFNGNVNSNRTGSSFFDKL